MIHVGQKLWFVPAERWYGSPQEVTVTKVGRKWAALDNSSARIDVETLIADGRGYMSPGRCYVDRAEYEERNAALKLWADTYRRLNAGSPPAGITHERILELRKEFGIDE